MGVFESSGCVPCVRFLMLRFFTEFVRKLFDSNAESVVLCQPRVERRAYQRSSLHPGFEAIKPESPIGASLRFASAIAFNAAPLGLFCIYNPFPKVARRSFLSRHSTLG